MIWPRSTTSDTCFDDGWEDASVDLEDFLTDNLGAEITNSVDTFYKLSMTVADDNVLTLTAYNEALDAFLPVAQASAPSGGGVLRLTAFIPRDTAHLFEITGSEPDVDYDTSFLTITRSKT